MTASKGNGRRGKMEVDTKMFSSDIFFNKYLNKFHFETDDDMVL